MQKLREFLNKLEKAMALGLEVEMVNDSPSLAMPGKRSTSKEIGVWAKEYALTTWNGYNQGFTFARVYTLQGAEDLKALYDKYTTEINEKRFTKIETSSVLYEEADLDNFIRLRKKENACKNDTLPLTTP